jgi:hypothetical protein
MRNQQARYEEIERIFDQMGWENLDWLAAWDGEDLEALREILDDEQYQTVLDELEDQDVRTS